MTRQHLSQHTQTRTYTHPSSLACSRPDGPPTRAVSPFGHPFKFLGVSPYTWGFTKKNELLVGRLAMLVRGRCTKGGALFVRQGGGLGGGVGVEGGKWWRRHCHKLRPQNLLPGAGRASLRRSSMRPTRAWGPSARCAGANAVRAVWLGRRAGQATLPAVWAPEAPPAQKHAWHQGQFHHIPLQAPPHPLPWRHPQVAWWLGRVPPSSEWYGSAATALVAFAAIAGVLAYATGTAGTTQGGEFAARRSHWGGGMHVMRAGSWLSQRCAGSPASALTVGCWRIPALHACTRIRAEEDIY